MSCGVLLLGLFVLTGCTIAPEGTTLSRMDRSFYHPDYGTPRSEIGGAAFRRDAEACDKEASEIPKGRPLSEHMAAWRAAYFDCWRAKGWRWE
ncbi:MAG TPA: hypothetical protein VGX21_22585 [Methylomirabilota bacterium]|jgi:hypothetical protein|nr:hypothetical protein [Methylomirabilota bacterium]